MIDVEKDNLFFFHPIKSGCGDGSGFSDLRVNSLSSIFEVDYYESLPYPEAERFCEIIGGTMLEKHLSVFPFELWIPKRDGKCVKSQAFGGGEILANCEERNGFQEKLSLIEAKIKTMNKSAIRMQKAKMPFDKLPRD